MPTQKDKMLSDSCAFDLIIQAIYNQRKALDDLMCVERGKMSTAYSHSRDNNSSVKHSVESIKGIILLYQQTLDQSLNTVYRLKDTLCSDTHFHHPLTSHKDEDYYPITLRSRKNEDKYYKTSHPDKYDDYYGRYWANRP